MLNSLRDFLNVRDGLPRLSGVEVMVTIIVRFIMFGLELRV